MCSVPDTGSYSTYYESNQEDHPVNEVDWNQARTFAQWVGGDLPSEAQWEYAARGGDGDQYTYAGSNTIDDVAWYSGNSSSSTQPVGQKDANGFGLYDLSGNVWEWTLDEYESSYNGAPTDGSPRCSNSDCTGSSDRIVRGGGWRNTVFNIRVADRSWDRLSYHLDHLGFRVLR